MRAEVVPAQGRGREVVGFVFLGAEDGCARFTATHLCADSAQTGGPERPRPAGNCHQSRVPLPCAWRLGSRGRDSPSHGTGCASAGPRVCGEEATGLALTGRPKGPSCGGETLQLRVSWGGARCWADKPTPGGCAVSCPSRPGASASSRRHSTEGRWLSSPLSRASPVDRRPSEMCRPGALSCCFASASAARAQRWRRGGWWHTPARPGVWGTGRLGESDAD